MPQAALGVDERILERATSRWRGDFDTQMSRIVWAGTCELEATIEPAENMAGGARARLGQQHPEAGGPNPNRAVCLACLQSDQVGEASSDQIECLTAEATLQLDHEH